MHWWINANLSDNRMNEDHWRLASWRRRQLLAITYYNDVIVTENHLHFITGRHIACKHLVNAFMFRHFRVLYTLSKLSELNDRWIPSMQAHNAITNITCLLLNIKYGRTTQDKHGEHHTLWCSYMTHDSKALYRIEVAIPPRRRPTIRIEKLLKCWKTQILFRR